ncbi:MAG TPA: hypothetical protein VGU03_08020 [Frateuria sp.]|uniref:hypothetical protein n=1 Tax=Frateuria sp. TaxID=2211372 RepID=UPI002DE6C8CE|nr:hypothetical protein [Frateuria sp.]
MHANGHDIYDISCAGKTATCSNHIQNGVYSRKDVPAYINNNDDLAQRCRCR